MTGAQLALTVTPSLVLAVATLGKVSVAGIARDAGMHPKTLQRFCRGAAPLSQTSLLALISALLLRVARIK